MGSNLERVKVRKYSYGKGCDTGTIGTLKCHFENQIACPYTIEQNKDSSIIQIGIASDDIIYGLGQNVKGINKKGYIYTSFCSDDPLHTPDKQSLYGAHNFFMVGSEVVTGIYIDFGGKIEFDMGFSNGKEIKIKVSGCDFDVYILEGDFKSVTKDFRKLIGPSYVPPKWGFGYQQSKWSYENVDAVKAIAEGFKTNDIPCDAIYLDIDYMERFKDFTVSDERFPDFKAFVETLKKDHIKLVPIIDAGVKIEEGYDVYEEGVEKDYFVTDENDSPFVAAVWPGLVHFPDFLNPDAREWFGKKYHRLMDMGIEGFWNDMNEPAIFYSADGLKEAFEYVKANENTNLDIYSFFALKDKMAGLSNAEKDYRAMYHRYKGEKVNHYDVHNLFGYNMTRAAAEGFESYDDNKRFLMITRASHIGMAKYSGIWTGDNHAWWEHLKLNIQMMPSLNMVGFLYAGADTGGFQGDAGHELMTRWMQFSLFTPLLRNHTAIGVRGQEPWQFGQETLTHVRDIIRLRYALAPYLYSEFMKANTNADMMFAPLYFDYKDRGSKKVEDQLLLGEQIMLTPIYEQNANGRYVYCPEDMLHVSLQSFERLHESKMAVYPVGYHHIDAEIDEIPLWIRPDQMILLAEPQNAIDKVDHKHLKGVVYLKDHAEYTLYSDDGITQDYKKGNYTLSKVIVSKTNEGLSLEVTGDIQSVELVVIDEKNQRQLIRY